MSALLEKYIDGVIAREGGYSDHPSDRGGPTKYGITENVARAHGYTGDMKDFPDSTAREIYRQIYWLDPKLDQVALKDAKVADELFDTGVNMGPNTACKLLQRALNVLNKHETAYPDVVVDGVLGKMSIFALEQYIAKRGTEGVMVLLKLLNALQACRYVSIAEADGKQEDFMYGWIKERVS